MAGMLIPFMRWATIALLLSACAGAPEREPFVPPVYPPAPEPPRFVYEMTLVSSGQVQGEDSESRMRRVLTGRANATVSLAKPFDVNSCEGIVFVSDTVHRMVHRFDFRNGAYDRIGLDGDGTLVKPMGLATDDQCRLYVADRQLRTIVMFDRDGNYLKGVGGPEYFIQLSHLAVENDGSRVYAVDTGGVQSRDHRIRVFDPNSEEHLYDFGSRGTGEGEFNLPKDIDLLPDGRLAIVDSGNFRVQVVEKDGSFVRVFGRVGRQMGQFARPKGIATDSDGNIYVVDTAFGNIQIFSSDGELLLFIGGRGDRPEPGAANLPAGVDVDVDGRIYFVDQFFRKVDIFRPWSLDTTENPLLGH
jgi:sugar lactone lactonase YvrE